MTEPLQFFIPCKGRLVSGDHDKIRTTDHNGHQEPDRAKHKYTFGIAFPKAELGAWMAQQLYPYLATAWANNQDAMNRLNAWWQQPGLAAKHGGASMKIADGDKPNSKGQVSEYTKGCFVIYVETFGSGYAGEHQYPAEPPKCYAGPNANSLVQIETSQIKRGDYVTFAGSANPNGKTGDQFGVFMNCSMLWKLEDGEAIVGGLDPASAFAGATMQGTYDPSAGAGASFGGTQPPAGAPGATNPPSAPGLGGTAPAGTPGQDGTPPAAPGTTASPGNWVGVSNGVPPGTQPHTDILNGGAGMAPGQPPAAGPAPGANPGLPGM